MKLKLSKVENPNFKKVDLGRIIDFYGEKCSVKVYNKNDKDGRTILIINGIEKIKCSYSLSDELRNKNINVDLLKYYSMYEYEGGDVFIVNSTQFSADELMIEVPSTLDLNKFSD